ASVNRWQVAAGGEDVRTGLAGPHTATRLPGQPVLWDEPWAFATSDHRIQTFYVAQNVHLVAYRKVLGASCGRRMT
ncbi:MAG TPA: hypothetical protein VN764_15145, partial [Polyangiaceae bacterium]|nr:hypothetical protein [Polyangiaceae bacterium]